MLLAHPSMHQLTQGLGSLPWGHSSYVFLLAVNVGAVILPYRKLYQGLAPPLSG
jgi:Mn2+/Fe2+ NRAMP family transporter